MIGPGPAPSRRVGRRKQTGIRVKRYARRRWLSQFSQHGEFIERHGGQLTAFPTKHQNIAEDLVVEVPLKVQAVTTAVFGDHRPDGAGHPLAESYFNLMFQLHPITRLKSVEGGKILSLLKCRHECLEFVDELKPPWR